MKLRLATCLFAFSIATYCVHAQVGVGTTTPNSTLDVRGSISTGTRTFTSSVTAGASDNTLVFSGTSAATLTLPNATTCSGRIYSIKNTSSNTSLLTINTTSSQTIDGATSRLLDEANESVMLVSDGSNWNVFGESTPSGSSTEWSRGGNSIASIQKLGTISAIDLPIITNNTERVRVTSTGNVAVGTSTFNALNPEKFLVDAGTTTSVNAIVGKGTINSYLQLNIQNLSNGTAASSDVVATADNGTETLNYVDMGINSSTYTATGILGGANNAYLYSAGNDFVIGNNTNNKALIFFTTIGNVNTERIRINNNGITPGQDNSYNLGSNTNRWNVVYATNGTIQTSDRRLKTNIKPLQYGLKEVLKLQPVSFDWKDKSGNNKVGLIAQEVKKVVPQVVVGDEQKENLGMNYAELVPVLINAIKEQQKEIDALKASLDALKKK